MLDIELVYSGFYYWVIHIWELSELDVKAWRKQHNDDTYWEDSEYLYERLVKYDANHRNIPIRKRSRAELEGFMKELSK